MEKPEDCPNEVYEIMLKCWDKNPKNRPSFEVLHNEIHEMWSKLKNPTLKQKPVTTDIEEMNAYAITLDETTYETNVQ